MDDYPIVLTGCDPRYNRKYEIPILYKDENLFIVHKPHNLRVDGPTEISPTLESHLIQAFGTNEKRDKRALYLLHQLDYVTSGVHCWGFNKRSASVV